MPTTITKYLCDVCHVAHDTFDQAIACENQQTHRNLELLQKGLIVDLYDSGEIEVGTVAAILDVKRHGHTVLLTVWSCGDMLGLGYEVLSVGDYVSSMVVDRNILHNDKPTRPGTYRFYRALTELQHRKIKPLTWDGEKVVPLNV